MTLASRCFTRATTKRPAGARSKRSATRPLGDPICPLLSNLCQKGRESPRPFTLTRCFTCKSRYLCGALGRTRTCDLLIRSQTRSRTGGDREGHGETKPRFYRQLSVLKGQGRTGRDTGLWYCCG